MSAFTSFSNNTTTTKPLSAAFTAAAKADAESSLIGGVTWNGDINWDSLGNDFKSALLALDQKMVLPQDSVKTRELDATTQGILDGLFDACTSHVSSKSDVDIAQAFGLMFRYLFYLRSVRVSGKKSRLLFYYLFNRIYAIFPKTCVALVELVPEFGYFGDLDALIDKMKGCHDVVDAAERTYINYLDSDCLLIFGKKLCEVTKDEAEALNNSLKTMSSEQVRAFCGERRVSLVAKWMKREGKSNSDHRVDMLIQLYFPNGGIRDLQRSTSSDDQQRAQKRLRYCQQRFRNVISALSQCLCVGEQMMCETDDTHRTWADIDITRAPAKFITKYRKALANEHLKVPLMESQRKTGNRHASNADRVKCRENLLATLVTGKLKGAMQDIDRLAKIVYDHCGNRKISPKLSSVERAVIVAQWNDMVSKLRTEIAELIEKAKADAAESETQFLDPQNVVAVIDTSGSMVSAGVQHIAIALGILASSISSMLGCLISFSDRPQVWKLDMSGAADVFDHFLAVINGPTGLSTNIDATYDIMLELMKSSGVVSTDFALMFLTDGQFDSEVVLAKDRGLFGKTAVGRLEAKFVAAGYSMPRTIFWNLNGRSPGFPSSSNTRGIQLVSGYSQSLMLQVFTGDYKYEVQADGTLKVDVDPWTSFHKAISNPGYDPVSKVVAATGESCLVHLRAAPIEESEW